MRRVVLQHDKAIGKLQRLARVGIVRQVAIQIGAGEHHDQRAIGKALAPRADRRVATTGVQRDQAVAARLGVVLPRLYYDPVVLHAVGAPSVPPCASCRCWRWRRRA